MWQNIIRTVGDRVGTARRYWDRYKFQGQRIDYYDYLAALLFGLDGLRTLKDIFLQDAMRYGRTSLRGRLSQTWLTLYQRAGGDLYATWQGHFPRSELAMIRAAQSLGNQALVTTLDELSRVLQLLQDAGRILSGMLWPAVLALCVAMVVSLAVPWFTLPRLMDTFSMVPPEYYGLLTSRLVRFSSFIEQYFLASLAAVLGCAGLIIWSLPHASGPIRRRLDYVLWWDAYRNFNALRFLAFLHIALGDDTHGAIQLRSALLRLRTGSSEWLGSHIDQMLGRLEHGIAGPDTFDTGLLSRQQFWFLSDVILARGIRTGLLLSRDRIQKQVLRDVARQATVMRWGVLLICVAYLLFLMLWHYAVIDELRRALTFYISG